MRRQAQGVADGPRKLSPSASTVIDEVPTLRFLTGFFDDISSQIAAVFDDFQRLKNGTAIFERNVAICKLLKDWLLRLDSNQQPSG
jgi:hypothetical protein